MRSYQKRKIDLITGFLGAGKTTFLLRYAEYLMTQRLKTGILVYDHGAMNVDAGAQNLVTTAGSSRETSCRHCRKIQGVLQPSGRACCFRNVLHHVLDSDII